MNSLSSARLPALLDVPIARPARKIPWLASAAGVLTLAGFGGLFSAGYFPQVQREADLDRAEAKAQDNVRAVSLIAPEKGSDAVELSLPATLNPYQGTEIYARIDGYLKRWSADIGTRVKAGDTLAEIDAPEFDQSLRQAAFRLGEGRAALEQAKTTVEEARAEHRQALADVTRAEANLVLSAKTVERFKDLEKKWAATVQQYDESVRNFEANKAELTAAQAAVNSKAAAIDSKLAAVRTQEANVSSLEAAHQRLKEMELFKTVVAPFDGVIVRRSVDAGALITAGNGGRGRELFTLAQDDRLRVQVNVPQIYAAAIKRGDTANVSVAQHPNRLFAATVTRNAGAIDTASRTLLVELEIANLGHDLMPGSFANIKISARQASAPVKIPANALLILKDGAHVATVGASHRVRLQKVALGRDLGTTVEILNGIAANDRLVVNPSDSLRDGESVRVESGEVAADLVDAVKAVAIK